MVTPFDLIDAKLYRSSPFAVPCPFCGSASAYTAGTAKLNSTQASYVAVELGGADADAYSGTVVGECNCTNQKCQERVHFIGSYHTERDDTEIPPSYEQRFVIEYFHPTVPLIRIPEGTPAAVATLLQRSFRLAFADRSGSGNRLRQAIEKLLTHQRVPRFIRSKKGKRIRLELHHRLDRLTQRLLSHRERLLAIKWIGNIASHDELNVNGLKLCFEIVEALLDELFGTKERELARAVRRINERKKP